ncbi:mycoides cluster lipoprotein, LppA/P72 family (plasmid) [Mesomycoplasma hyorhinis]|uniref:LppA-related lipoprotein n=1 Tax=Mesomycoplasma hyorhinis TaxID=2100 RepID=UPI0010051778|nr:mycoides cluster lipoprotein, LppA/P72 family [Mesomycoplasma hyorhinis]
MKKKRLYLISTLAFSTILLAISCGKNQTTPVGTQPIDNTKPEDSSANQSSDLNNRKKDESQEQGNTMAGNTNNTSPEARATENQTKPPTNPANDMATMLEQNKPVDDQQHPPKEEEKRSQITKTKEELLAEEKKNKKIQNTLEVDFFNLDNDFLIAHTQKSFDTTTALNKFKSDEYKNFDYSSFVSKLTSNDEEFKQKYNAKLDFTSAEEDKTKKILKNVKLSVISKSNPLFSKNKNINIYWENLKIEKLQTSEPNILVQTPVAELKQLFPSFVAFSLLFSNATEGVFNNLYNSEESIINIPSIPRINLGLTSEFLKVKQEDTNNDRNKQYQIKIEKVKFDDFTGELWLEVKLYTLESDGTAYYKQYYFDNFRKWNPKSDFKFQLNPSSSDFKKTGTFEQLVKKYKTELGNKNSVNITDKNQLNLLKTFIIDNLTLTFPETEKVYSLNNFKISNYQASDPQKPKEKFIIYPLISFINSNSVADSSTFKIEKQNDKYLLNINSDINIYPLTLDHFSTLKDISSTSASPVPFKVTSSIDVSDIIKTNQ